MVKIKDKDLIDGQIYVCTEYSIGNIFMWCSKINDAKYYTTNDRSGFAKNGGCFKGNKNRLATFEESQWLLAMIKANKYIKFSKLKLENIYELW